MRLQVDINVNLSLKHWYIREYIEKEQVRSTLVLENSRNNTKTANLAAQC